MRGSYKLVNTKVEPGMGVYAAATSRNVPSGRWATMLRKTDPEITSSSKASRPVELNVSP